MYATCSSFLEILFPSLILNRILKRRNTSDDVEEAAQFLLGREYRLGWLQTRKNERGETERERAGERASERARGVFLGRIIVERARRGRGPLEEGAAHVRGIRVDGHRSFRAELKEEGCWMWLQLLFLREIMFYGKEEEQRHAKRGLAWLAPLKV